MVGILAHFSVLESPEEKNVSESPEYAHPLWVVMLIGDHITNVYSYAVQ